MAQHAPGAKSFTLTGKVTEVGKDRLTVNHPAIPGYMAAMTMPYKVDKPEVLARVKAGDQIEATVYENDYTLYNLRVINPPADKHK
jgi:Cu/Ag efflux protein CusF